MRAIVTVVLVTSVVACTAFVARRAAYQAEMNNDEAGSVVAVQGILKHGVPELPSGLIYWRSPMSHYLDAVSTAILGDREIGWRGASIVAFALTLLLPGMLLLRRGHPVLALAWPLLLVMMPPIQDIAWSARMYMVYTCFAWMVVVAAVFWRPQRFDRRGTAYVVASGAAALSHQHFVLFVPGLLTLGFCDWLIERPRTVRRLARPMLVAPIAGLALAAALHFGENGFFPRAFPNKASMPTTMGAHASFAFPLDVVGEALPISALALYALLLAFVIARRRRPGDNTITSALGIVVLPAYVALSLMLPNKLDYYVAPLLPILLLTALSVAVVDPAPPRTSQATLIPVVLLLIAFAIIRFAHTPPKLAGVGPRLTGLMQMPSKRDTRAWQVLSRFVTTRHAVVLTSEPEFALLRLPRVDYHVRNYGVTATQPCERIMDDGVTIPYAHSTCQLEEVVHGCIQTGGTALFVGARLGGSIGASVTQYIRNRFRPIGTFLVGEEVYCYGAGCDSLATDFSTIRE